MPIESSEIQRQKNRIPKRYRRIAAGLSLLGLTLTSCGLPTIESQTIVNNKRVICIYRDFSERQGHWERTLRDVNGEVTDWRRDWRPVCPPAITFGQFSVETSRRIEDVANP